MPETFGSKRPLCACCGDVIGAYEPVRAVLGDGTALAGSWLTLRGELTLSGTRTLHERCHSDEQAPRAARRAQATRSACIPGVTSTVSSASTVSAS